MKLFKPLRFFSQIPRTQKHNHTSKQGKSVCLDTIKHNSFFIIIVNTINIYFDYIQESKDPNTH